MAKNTIVAAMNTASVIWILGRQLRVPLEPPAPRDGCPGGQGERRHGGPGGDDPQQGRQDGDHAKTSGADHQTSVGGSA
jgi:hypothetical protein